MLDEFLELLEERDRKTLPNVLFVSSECAPLSKTGGLADVVGTLPKYLKKFGMDARVITPYHKVIKDKFSNQVSHMFDFYVNLGWRHEYCGIEKMELDGTIIYLVDSENYFGDVIYRGGGAEIEQYAFFQRAVLDALPILDFSPEIIHCNDWQAGMIPMLARTQYRGSMQEKCKYLLSIHNIAYQGKWGFEYIQDLLNIDRAFYTPEFIELNKCANFLKAGCVFADRLSTVSPNYSNEIKTPYYAEGLEGILNARSSQLNGILNGIDINVFNPENDDLIPSSYSVGNLSGKAKCKEKLQKQLGLDIEPNVPVISMVSRMTEQKGFDLVMTVLDDMMTTENVQFVLLGTGDNKYEQFMRDAEQRYKGRLCSYIGYSEELSHLVYAGSDFFLMPSRFEPCGLSQMIAMRYGTLPIVRETGGLKDSVIPYNYKTGEGDGFSFANYDAWEMRKLINYALSCYPDKDVMNKLINNAMSEDFSFERSAIEYIKLYITLLDGYHETLPVVSHICSEEKYRKPFGALICGESASFAFEIVSGRVKSASLVIYDDNESFEYAMKQSGNMYIASFNAPTKAAVYQYYFKIETKYGTRYLCPDLTGLNGAIFNTVNNGFRLTVYLNDFDTPNWFKGKVMYQIFPDRFGFTSKSVATKGAKYHKDIGQKIEMHNSIDEPVKYLPSKGEIDYSPNDFYGGTLKGIAAKLPYLNELGVGCIYLNPIFESPSNHRYNTSDYLNVDPILGTNEDYVNLCNEANKLGIKIILDGVFSHTGSDSRYFNLYGHYHSNGACQSKDSDYYSWYKYYDYPNEYKCWWNFKDLPEVDERNSNWQKFIITGDNSVIKTWVERGTFGYRLDVADEIPDDVLALMRSTLKGIDPELLLIGEVWEDCVTKCGPEGPRNYALGFSLDSVMNYPLRWAILDFLHFRGSAFELRDFLLTQQINYPKPLYYSLMNILSSHDLDRIRTALATNIVLRGLPREEQLNIKISTKDLNRALKLEKLAATIQFCVPGVPCIYYGDEQGMSGVGDPFNRMPFKEDNHGLYSFYEKLSKKHNSCKTLQFGNAKFIALSYDVIAIVRYSEGEKGVLALINRSDEEFEFELDCSFASAGIVKGKIAGLSSKILNI